MKPITKKVIEAGLVPKHTILLMQKWGYLDPDASEIPSSIHTDLKSGFTKFVEELEELLEDREAEVRETKFSITLKDPFTVEWHPNSGEGQTFVVFKDEMERLIFPPSSYPSPGKCFATKSSSKVFEIEDSTPLWVGGDIVAYQVTASKR